MRFLLDENLSPRLADLLRSAAHDVDHVCDIGLIGADDRSVMAAAASDDRVLVSADTDFGALLALSGARRPSLLLMRRASGRRVAAQASLILEQLDVVARDLDTGAIVVLGEATLRIHRLPIGDDA